MTGLFLLWVAIFLAAAAVLPAACGEGVVESPTPATAPSPTAAPVVGPASQPAPSPSPSADAPSPPAPAVDTPAPVEARPLAAVELEPAFPGIEFDRMVFLTYAERESGSLFVVLQPGRIVVFENDPGVESARTFLDIRERVNDAGNEEGLLGLAFDPAFAENGYFYVYYTASRPRRSVVSRFSVSPDDPNLADPDSELVFLEVEQPYRNHNGGHLAFGPDGMLYVGLGDGGSSGDPRGNGQDTSTLLGSILRIDVSVLDETGRLRGAAGQPLRRRRGGGPRGDMGLRPAQPLAVQLRPRDGRPVGRRRGAESIRRGERRQAGPQLRVERDGGLALLPAGELRLTGPGDAGRRVRPRRRMLGDGRVRVPRASPADPVRSVPVRRLLQRQDMGAEARWRGGDGADAHRGHRAVHLLVRRGPVGRGLRADVRGRDIPLRGAVSGWGSSMLGDCHVLGSRPAWPVNIYPG